MTAADEANGPRAQRRAPRWMKIALVLSIAFNLAAIGVVGAAAFNMRRHGMMGDTEGRGFRAFLGRLPAERRDAVRAILEPRRVEIRQLRQRTREARDKVRALFGAEPFDATAFRAAHEAMVAAESELRQRSQSVFPDVVEKLSAEDRRRLADWHDRRERWRDRFRRRHEHRE